MLESLPTNNMSGNLTLGCFQLARLLFLLGHAFFLPVREGHPIFDCPFCHVPAHPGEKIGCCLTFGSHADAFALHECARAHGYSTRISTTPRGIQASCGVALLVECGDVAHLEELARRERIDMEDIVPLPCQIDPRRDKYC